MRVNRPIAIIVLALFATGCSAYEQGAGDPESSSSSPASAAPSSKRAAALIDTVEGSVLFEVEVARTDEEKKRGLMGRESLPEDRGMAFVFFEPTTTGFWMKDTQIPLSIAFIGSDGRIQELQDMDPCGEEDCPVYTPSDPYALALEVNQGAFEAAGVQIGDRVTISF